MDLSPEQKATVATWVQAGAGLSDVQQRLEADWGIRMTYMDVRFLIDDLEVALPEKAEAPAPPKKASAPGDAGPGLVNAAGQDVAEKGPAAPGKVSVRLDKLARPGALVSGAVTFSDGTKAQWLLDQMGRLGLEGVSPDYRPSDEDMVAFQRELQEAARQLGL